MFHLLYNPCNRQATQCKSYRGGIDKLLIYGFISNVKPESCNFVDGNIIHVPMPLQGHLLPLQNTTFVQLSLLLPFINEWQQ